MTPSRIDIFLAPLRQAIVEANNMPSSEGDVFDRMKKAYTLHAAQQDTKHACRLWHVERHGLNVPMEEITEQDLKNTIEGFCDVPFFYGQENSPECDLMHCHHTIEDMIGSVALLNLMDRVSKLTDEQFEFVINGDAEHSDDMSN